jgi:nitroimidazol reductase NimA-like FMN-containing flavoprotein (pyridoxamine 5'-phosphate oxidase superfamily)
MRKANREITDREVLTGIFESCDVCRLGLSDGGMPYVVPMNFGYSYEGDRLTLYFHCAGAGKKLDVIARNPNACFEMDCGHELKPGDSPCNYSMNYRSIIGYGRIEVVTDPAEKIAALTVLMQKYSETGHFHFDEKVLAVTTVLRLDVSEFTGKQLAE